MAAARVCRYGAEATWETRQGLWHRNGRVGVRPNRAGRRAGRQGTEAAEAA
jgi:hypothetical protein